MESSSQSKDHLHQSQQPDGIFIKAIAGYLIKDLSEVSVTRLLFAKN